MTGCCQYTRVQSTICARLNTFVRLHVYCVLRAESAADAVGAEPDRHAGEESC